MLHTLDQIVAKARASQVPAPERIAELERAYDGPIPDALRFPRHPVVTAYNGVAEMRFWTRQQIEAIRGWETTTHLTPEQYGKRMASLYAELRRLRAVYRYRQAALMALLRGAEAYAEAAE